MSLSAIVGAGIGGASSAFYLDQLLQSNVQIDVFEAGEIGGRLATTFINDEEYESGGSIIHPANQYMVNFTQLLSESFLHHCKRSKDIMAYSMLVGLVPRDRPDGRLAIFNGEQMVFDGSNHTAVMIAQLLWHYGFDIFRIQSYVKGILSNFAKYVSSSPIMNL
jgi:prenylcysteine oxidase/farnesylcysteine lyase